MTQKLTNTMFTGTLASSKLTGAFGSNDGSALTGLGGSGATISASDPTISTNPAGGVGTLWSNSTSGDLFCCTGATSNANVWVNVGSGIGDIEPAVYYGFSSGGRSPTADIGTIQRYAFASSSSAAGFGNLSVTRYTGESGTSSATHGYVAGGYNNTINAPDGTIDKFTFASSSNATDVGDCVNTGNVRSGVSSTTHGYTGGGPGPTGANIEKYSFSTNGNATVTATMSQARSGLAGVSGPTRGYFAGGRIGSTYQNDIESITFSSDTANGDIGSLSGTRRTASGHQTTTYGYVVGGLLSGPHAVTNIVDSFAFASTVTTTDVGDLVTARAQAAPASSTTHGYTAGGGISPEGTNVSTIERYQFASGSAITSSSVGNLTVACYAASGHQSSS